MMRTAAEATTTTTLAESQIVSAQVQAGVDFDLSIACAQLLKGNWLTLLEGLSVRFKLERELVLLLL